MIKIDDKFSLRNDGFKGCALVFEEERTREKLDKDKNKTGETYKFKFKDSWYFANMDQCLEEYLRQTGSKVGSIQECIEFLKQKNMLLEQIRIDFNNNRREFFNNRDD